MCDRPLPAYSNRACSDKPDWASLNDVLNRRPAMTNDRTIVITGVTGNQGGAVAQARQGNDVVKVDLDDEATLRRAVAGAWGVFGVQNTLEAGVEQEEAQGK